MESLRAAVINGADAVYLGASNFSARAKAVNFDNEELLQAVNYCHLFGVKVYLAVNTLIKPEEYDAAFKTIISAKNIGIDAFILQDLSFLTHFHSTLSDINIHLSTQAGVHNPEGAKVAQKLGVKRIILSRETLLEDIVKIREETDLEIESFIHGALCVAFSGNCYFSSLAAGLSGNRGRCLQLCRKKYSFAGRDGYFLSAKDIDLSEKIAELTDAGVTSFKIEGRMRRPEYVGETVRHYKALLNGAYESSETLKKIFNRGDFCPAYLNDPTENVIYPFLQGHKGVTIGKVNEIKGGKAVLSLNKPLHKGDGIKFLRNGYETGSASVISEGCKIGFSGNVKPGDIVNITTDEALMEEIRSRTRRLPVKIFLYAKSGEPLKCELCCGESAIESISEFKLEPAENSPLTESDFKDCFCKTGDTCFDLTFFACEISNSVFLPKSRLNDFRRLCYKRLEDKILENYALSTKKINAANHSKFSFLDTYAKNNVRSEADILIQTDDLSLPDGIQADYSAVYYPKKYDLSVIDCINDFKNRTNKKIYLALPALLRGGDVEIIKKIISDKAIEDLLVNNLGHLELVGDKKFILGPLFNMINPSFPLNKITSPEYDGKNYENGYAYAFGKFPLMTFAHCPIKNLNGGCDKCRETPEELHDEYGNKFLIRRYKVKYCYAQLLNCVPINVLYDCAKLNINRKFIDLIGCTKKETDQAVAGLSKTFNCGKTGNFTRGYFAKKMV
ncbi:MAG: peptidase U32 family protein [Christensenellales bacterium]